MDLNSKVPLNKSYQMASLRYHKGLPVTTCSAFVVAVQSEIVCRALLGLLLWSLLPQESHGANSAPVWCFIGRYSS